MFWPVVVSGARSGSGAVPGGAVVAAGAFRIGKEKFRPMTVLEVAVRTCWNASPKLPVPMTPGIGS
jgi:hypothetical protein